MYKIVSITDRAGNIKQSFIDELKAIHPSMSGEILHPEYVKEGSHLCLAWNDDTNKMLRTSTIEQYKIMDNGNILVVTRNSKYLLEKVEE